jgi:uncharacterized protein (TIGR02453 family)
VTFESFPREGLDFLERLAENNDRAWFNEHRQEYEEHVLEPARDLVAAMGDAFDRAGIDVHAEPKVGGSIMRIARDTRFSKDRRPYKTHLDLWFWEGSCPSRDCPGYFFRLTPETLVLGAGMHRFERSVLERYREAVAYPGRGEALVRAVERVRAAGAELGGRAYKRVPRGYEAEGARADLLLHDGLYAWIELAKPRETHTSSFPGFCVDRFRTLEPVQAWVVELTAR